MGKGDGNTTARLQQLMQGFCKIAHLTALLQLPGQSTDLACGVYKRVVESRLLGDVNKNVVTAACLVSVDDHPPAREDCGCV